MNARSNASGSVIVRWFIDQPWDDEVGKPPYDSSRGTGGLPSVRMGKNQHPSVV
jgi:hypothetical protein